MQIDIIVAEELRKRLALGQWESCRELLQKLITWDMPTEQEGWDNLTEGSEDELESLRGEVSSLESDLASSQGEVSELAYLLSSANEKLDNIRQALKD
jgi:predicted nuclease with TOPRIM domain